jgi:DNA-binding NarL/FixJ family response regulator
MRGAIEAVLSAGGFEVVGAASNAGDVLDLIEQKSPDVAVLDAAMLGMDGEQLGRACSKTRVVIYTGSDGNSVLRDGVEPGAFAYVSKSQGLTTLVDVVGIVAGGGSWVDPAVSPILVAKGARAAGSLTPREREVLELVADGRSYQEIADLLEITVSTVQQHVASAIHRLAADTRTQAVAVALRRFLID